MRVGVDIDGVILDFHARFVELYNNWFDMDMGPVEEWDGLTDQTHFDSAAEAIAWFDRLDGWDDLPMVRGAGGAIDSLIKDGHNVVFVTARYGPSADAAVAWHRASPWADTSGIVTHMPTKQNVPCAVYIDDSPHVLVELKRAAKTAIIFDQPWNRKVRSGTRARGWAQVLEFVEALNV